MISLSIARIISIVSNPIFILIGLPYFLVLRSMRDAQTAWYWSMYTWVFLIAFVLVVLIGIRKKLFSNIDVSDREERPVLYFTGGMLSLLYLYGLFLLQGPVILFVTIIGIMFGILIGGLINSRIKVSVHVSAVSALLTAVSVVYKGYYVLFLLSIPIVCWSRVKIQRHTSAEVVVGAVLGSLLSLIVYFTTKSFLHI